MKRAVITTAVLCLALSAGGCGRELIPQMQPKKKEEQQALPVKIQDALFCFKCHSYERYTGAAGRFPHIKHKKEFGIGFHCNQCHDFKGHHRMAVIKKSNAPCSNCH